MSYSTDNSLTYESRRSGSWKKKNTNIRARKMKKRENFLLYKNNLKKIKEHMNIDLSKTLKIYADQHKNHMDGIKELEKKWKKAVKKKRKLEKIMKLDRKRNMKKRRKLSVKSNTRTSSRTSSNTSLSLSTNTIESIGFSKKSDYDLDEINRKIDKMDYVLKFLEHMEGELIKHLDKEEKNIDREERVNKEHWGWAKKAARAAAARARRAAAAARRRAAAAAAAARRRAAAAARRAREAARRAAAAARRKAEAIRRAAARAAAAAKRAAARAAAKVKAAALAAKRKAAALARAAAARVKAAARAFIKRFAGNKSDPWWMKAIKAFPGGTKIYRAVKKWSKKLTAPLRKVINKARSAATSAWNKVKSMTNKIKNFAKKLKDLPGRLFKKAWTSITNTFKRAGRFVTDSVKSVFKGMKKVAKSAFSWIKKAVSTVSKGIKKFASKGWTWIKSTAKKMFGFFKKILIKIWNWFKKIMTRLFAFLKALFFGKGFVARIMRTLVKIVLNLFLGPPGMMIARIKYLNSTLDKWWLMIPPLSIFPLSIAGTAMFMNGKIKKGVDDELPYDTGYMKLIVLLGIALPVMQLVLDTTWFSWLYAIFVFGIWFFVYSMRDQKKCKKVRGRKDGWKPAKFIRTASNAALMFVILRDFMEIFFALLGKLPYVGVIFNLLNGLPFFNKVIAASSSAVLTYILNNMLNNTPFTKYCNDYPMKKAKNVGIRSLVSLLVYFLMYVVNYNMKEMIKFSL